MKVEFADVSETRKRLTIEIPSEAVDAEIERLARRLGRTAKVPGFRPGKVPASVVWQRFKDEILHDVAHDLVPQALDSALQERDLEPVDTPDVRDVVVEQGEPLTFVATVRHGAARSTRASIAAWRCASRPPRSTRRPWTRRWSGSASGRRDSSPWRAGRSRPTTGRRWISTRQVHRRRAAR